MFKKVIFTAIVAVIALSGCSATKAEVKKTEVKKTEVKAVATQKVEKAGTGIAKSLPSSEFFK